MGLRFKAIKKLISLTQLSRCQDSTSKANATNSVDAKEINYFSGVNDWWLPGGSMSALRSYNLYRIDYIKQMLKNKSNILNKPLQGLKMLDIGCGGGLLCEVRQ
jgi:2-polyprenyl-6-hydroxyphenyl methylase / 3-demethylubiquinone-9 3-methyltransferase